MGGRGDKMKQPNIDNMFKTGAPLFDALVDETERYLREHPQIKCMVIGFSGGADSTLTGVIAQAAAYRVEGVKLLGVMLPGASNKGAENARAKLAAGVLSHSVYEKNIDEMVNFLADQLDILPLANGDFEDKIRLGNIKARVRMIYLYNLARKHNGLVLSTDNYTELLLGFWTLHGDVGDFSPIQELWKTEVYGLLHWLHNEEKNPIKKEMFLSAINATPTDGLGITDSDLDQLEAPSYEEVDRILFNYLKEGTSEWHPVVQRHLKSQFKRDNPVNITRSRIVSIAPEVMVM
jgi:NAD+ synthase